MMVHLATAQNFDIEDTQTSSKDHFGGVISWLAFSQSIGIDSIYVGSMSFQTGEGGLEKDQHTASRFHGK